MKRYMTQQRRMAVVGLIAGSVLGLAIGAPSTLILVFHLYWDQPNRIIPVNLFLVIITGGFVMSGAIAGGLIGYLTEWERPSD